MHVWPTLTHFPVDTFIKINKFWSAEQNEKTLPPHPTKCDLRQHQDRQRVHQQSLDFSLRVQVTLDNERFQSKRIHNGCQIQTWSKKFRRCFHDNPSNSSRPSEENLIPAQGQQLLGGGHVTTNDSKTILIKVARQFLHQKHFDGRTHLRWLDYSTVSRCNCAK
jgi:hypothetical protein